jgi:tetratricopeptide (TPR) repeat protein
MPTDPTLASRGTDPVRSQSGRSFAEDAQLDDAIRRADDLLVQSLRVEERLRKRRILRRLLVPIGALIMLATAYKIVLLLGILSTATPTPAAADATAPDLLLQAQTLWAKQQYPAAEEKFQASLKLDPSSPEAWNGLGWSQLNQGKFPEAQKTFLKATSLDPNNAGAQNGLGQAYFATAQFDKAEAPLLTSAKMGADAAYWGLAKLYLLRSQWDDAATYAQKIVDAGDPSAKPLLDAAKSKSLPASLKSQITPTPPSPSTASIQKGWRELNQNHPAQAIATFQSILAKDPANANALNGLGWANLHLGNHSDAKSAFQKALDADPNAAGSMNGLALCLKAEGKTDEAIPLWQKMVDQYPTPNAGTSGLATVYFERHQFDKALPLLQQLAKADPTNPQTQQMLQTAQSASPK